MAAITSITARKRTHKPITSDGTKYYSVLYSVTLNNGTVLRCPVAWSEKDLQGNTTPETISALFQSLMVTFVDALMEMVEAADGQPTE